MGDRVLVRRPTSTRDTCRPTKPRHIRTVPGYAGNAGVGVLYAVEGIAREATVTVRAATVDGIAGECFVGGAAVNDAVGKMPVVEGVMALHTNVPELLLWLDWGSLWRSYVVSITFRELTMDTYPCRREASLTLNSP